MRHFLHNGLMVGLVLVFGTALTAQSLQLNTLRSRALSGSSLSLSDLPDRVGRGVYPIVACAGDQGTLPLLVTRFTARRTDPKTVALGWDIVAADTPTRWALERRLGETGAFRPVRELPDALVRARAYEDTNVYAGRSYYRMRGIVEGVEDRFTAIRWVDNEARREALVVFPNPTSSRATVQLPQLYAAGALILTDAIGRRVIEQTIPATTPGTVDLEVAHLPPGAYQLLWMPGAPEVKLQSTRLVIHRR